MRPACSGLQEDTIRAVGRSRNCHLRQGDSWPTSGHHSRERRWVAQEAKLQGQLPNSGIDGVLAMTPKVGDLKVLSRSPENPIRNFEESTTFKSP